MHELKPQLKEKLREEYKTEADLLAHKDELCAWVKEAMYPDNQVLEATYKDKFKGKKESLFTGQEASDKKAIMLKRDKRRKYLERFFTELVAIYKTIGVGNTFFQLVQQETGADDGGINPYETAINLKPPFYILLVGPPMSGKTFVTGDFISKTMSGDTKTFDRIIVATTTSTQPAWQVAQKEYGVEFTDMDNLPDIDDDSGEQKLLIFDDVLGEKMEEAVTFFMRGRHAGYSLMFLTQSYYETDSRIRKKCDVVGVLGFNSERDQKLVLGECCGGIEKSTMLDVYKHVTQTPHTPLVIHLRAKGDEPRFFRGFSEAVQMARVPHAETDKAVRVARAEKKGAVAGAGAGAVAGAAKKAGADDVKHKPLPAPAASFFNGGEFVSLRESYNSTVTDEPVSNMTSNAGSAPHPHAEAGEATTKECQKGSWLAEHGIAQKKSSVHERADLINDNPDGLRDFYATPRNVAETIVSYVPAGMTVFDPCDGKGGTSTPLRDAGFTVLCRDKYPQDGSEPCDFYEDTMTEPFDVIVCNPPYDQKEKWIAKCEEYGKPFMLLLPLDSLKTKYMHERNFQLLIVPPAKYMKEDGTEKCMYAAAWYIFGLPRIDFNVNSLNVGVTWMPPPDMDDSDVPVAAAPTISSLQQELHYCRLELSTWKTKAESDSVISYIDRSCKNCDAPIFGGDFCANCDEVKSECEKCGQMCVGQLCDACLPTDGGVYGPYYGDANDDDLAEDINRCENCSVACENVMCDTCFGAGF